MSMGGLVMAIIEVTALFTFWPDNKDQDAVTTERPWQCGPHDASLFTNEKGDVDSDIALDCYGVNNDDQVSLAIILDVWAVAKQQITKDTAATLAGAMKSTTMATPLLLTMEVSRSKKKTIFTVLKMMMKLLQQQQQASFRWFASWQQWLRRWWQWWWHMATTMAEATILIVEDCIDNKMNIAVDCYVLTLMTTNYIESTIDNNKRYWGLRHDEKTMTRVNTGTLWKVATKWYILSPPKLLLL